jgi:Flp pilus assembly protein TadB
MTNFTIDQPSPTTIYSHDPTLHPSSNATNPCATHTCNIWFILTWVALPLVFIVNFTLCCLFVVQVAMYSHKKRKLHRQQINNLSDSVVFL